MMTNKEDAVDKIDTVIEDCETQINKLKQMNDVGWDCYYVGNWEAMRDALEYVKKELEK